MKRNTLGVFDNADCFALHTPSTLTYSFLVGKEVRVRSVSLSEPVVDCQQVLCDSKSNSILFCNEMSIRYAQLPQKVYGIHFAFEGEELRVEQVIRSVFHE